MAEAFGPACHELVSLDFRCGSGSDSRDPLLLGPLSGDKQTKSARKPTSAGECRMLGVDRTCLRHGRKVWV